MSLRFSAQVNRVKAYLLLLFAGSILVPLGVGQTTAPLFPVEPSFSLTSNNPILTTDVGLTFLSGDFNGDGLLDSVVLLGASLNPSNIAVLLSNKSSTPSQVLTPISNCTSPFLAAADLNQDGKLDLALSCGGNYVEVFLGNDDGTFQAPILDPAPTPVGGFVLADFNGDGLADLAYSNNTGFAIALNLGEGMFGSPQTYPLQGLFVLASGDFNGDGKQDLIFGNQTGSAAYELGNGDGTFGSPQSLPANVDQLVVGDFNHDGYSDVAYFSALFHPNENYPFVSNVVVLLGGSSGLAATGQSIPTNGSVITFLQAVDLTGSGRLDLVLQNNTGVPSGQPSNTLIFLGDGKGQFSAPLSYAAELVYGVVDLNGDGIPDLAGVNNNVLLYAAGLGDGTFQAFPNTPNGQFAQTVAVADLNGDGLADAVLYDQNGVPLVFLSRGDGRFTPVPNSSPPAPPGLLVAADFTGDGKIDIASIAPGRVPNSSSDPGVNGAISMYLGNGDGTLYFKQQTSIPYQGVTAAVAGDFNGDHKQDLVLLTYNIVSIAVGAIFLPGNGDGTFGGPEPITLLDQSQADLHAPLQAIDLNGDGITDLVIGGGSYLGTPSGGFTPLQVLPVSDSLVAALLGNGTLDLLSAGTGSVYSGSADGTFATTPVSQVGSINGSLYSVAIGGLHGNGLPDVVSLQGFSGAQATLNVFANQGSGSFVADPVAYFAGEYFNNPPLITVGFGGSTVALVRLNANSPASGPTQRLDALLYTSGGLTSLLNQLNPTPKPSATVAVSFAGGVTSITTGAMVTVNAALSAPGTTAPTGTVTFFAGSVQLGASTVVGGVASVTAPITGVGTVVIRAVYSGDGNYGPSTGFASLMVNAPVATTTTLTASAIDVNEQQQVALTATVQGNSPTGTVTFLNGSTSLGTALVSGGSAVLTTSFAGAGSVSLTAGYGGDANNLASTSAPVVISVAAPSFTVTGSPTSATVQSGQAAVFTLTVTPAGGFASAVSLNCGALPSEAACSFSAPTVTPVNGQAASVKLTITTTAAAASAAQRTSSWFPAGAVMSLAGLLGFVRRRGRRWQGMALLGIAVSIFFFGCGGGSNPPPSNPGTPAGTATITVSATVNGGTSLQTVNLQLVVQ